MVLISDLHEMPMLDVRAAKFTARVEDWSADVSRTHCADVHER